MSLSSLALRHWHSLGLGIKPWDPLLPIACLLFLDPSAAAGGSSMPAMAWLAFEIFFCVRSERIIMWPCLALLFTGWRSFLQYPESVLDSWDIILLVISVVAISRLAAERLIRIQQMLILVLPFGFLLAFFHPVPPENMRAFLSGMLTTLALAHAKYTPGLILRFALFVFAVGGLWMGYSYDSVASIVFPLIAFGIGICVLCDKGHRRILGYVSSSLIALGSIALVVYCAIHPIWANAQYLSNLARVQIWWCYLSSALAGLHRFLFGVGYEATIGLCQQPTAAGILPHAHSFPLQVMAGTGAVGLIGLALLFSFCCVPPGGWKRIENNFKLIAISGMIYALLQFSIDISAFVNPVTIVLAAFLLSAPYVFGRLVKIDRS
jgi:hypothetical protein